MSPLFLVTSRAFLFPTGLARRGGAWGGWDGVRCLFSSALGSLPRAAEAVLQGRADSILAYHQQNVPRAKLDQVCQP